METKAVKLDFRVIYQISVFECALYMDLFYDALTLMCYDSCSPASFVTWKPLVPICFYDVWEKHEHYSELLFLWSTKESHAGFKWQWWIFRTILLTILLKEHTAVSVEYISLGV